MTESVYMATWEAASYEWR